MRVRPPSPFNPAFEPREFDAMVLASIRSVAMPPRPSAVILPFPEKAPDGPAS